MVTDKNIKIRIAHLSRQLVRLKKLVRENKSNLAHNTAYQLGTDAKELAGMIPWDEE